MGHFKVVNDRIYGKDTKVFYVDDDGKEKPINTALKEVRITATVEDLNEIVLIGHCEFDVVADGCEFKIAKNKFVDK